MNDVISDYIVWAFQTFPDETIKSQGIHLVKELEELEQKPDSWEEIVDCLFMAELILHRVLSRAVDLGNAEGVKWWQKLREEQRKKLDKNKARRWIRTPDGDFQHVED